MTKTFEGGYNSLKHLNSTKFGPIYLLFMPIIPIGQRADALLDSKSV